MYFYLLKKRNSDQNASAYFIDGLSPRSGLSLPAFHPPRGTVPGGTRQLPPASSPAWGAHAIPRSRNVRSIFGPLCSHREQQTGGSDPAGQEPAAKGMKEPIRLWLPLTSGRLAGATARIRLPRADLEPCSRAHPCLSERLRGSRPWCLCLTTALMEKLVGMRGVQGV